ncbi:MAG TPA: trehalase family glycosidase [Ktedonobacteraceae bacterium]|jgi:hypothetical protein
MIPSDDFTPHGYLDNPYHSWKLNPGGVLRSLPPLGMGWHVPNLGSYVNNQFQYTAHLTVGLKINDLVLITPEDFRRHRCVISSPLHTRNRFAYTCRVVQYDLTLRVCYFLVQEHALGCLIELESALQYPLSVTCYLIHLHTHNPHTSRLWEHGWYALHTRAEGYAMLGLASEGDVFTHGARAQGEAAITWTHAGLCTSLVEIGAWANGARVPPPGVTQRDPETGWQHRALALAGTLTVGETAMSAVRLHALLARGVSQDLAYRCWHDALEQFGHAEARLRQDDERFWQQAPQLQGEWPETWRRGLAYDLETLRMVIRPPAGVVPGPFDGMQIQAPRLVLAEAAMDALFFSYADPALAAELLLTHFSSAPRPNLPCMREDGSYNMVADDGQVCGTAPEWGYPLWCADQLWRRSGDISWLQRLYPGVAAYLRWWLEQRHDSEGWLTYKCSWESGQDVSSRFGPQQTGGTIIEHVRPVDLQASMAQSAAILASWAEILSPTHIDETRPNPYLVDIAFWQETANEFTAKTRFMWRDGWFRDYDAVRRIWSSERDAMHLAPIFCGIADQNQIAQLRPTLAEPPRHSSQWAPLSWPPVVLTLIGATAAAQMPQEAAELAYRFIDASFRSTDSRELDEYGGLPGVTREYRRTITREKWGEIDYANAGIEGYGWGALSIHLLIRHLLGLHATDPDTIVLAPTLPQALRRPGATYAIAPIPWGKHALSLTCQVKNEHSYEATLQVRPRTSGGQIEEIEARPEMSSEQKHQWEGTWGEERTIQLSP